MKKLLVVMLILLTLFSALSLTASAETAKSASVYVTIADKDGKLALTQEKITVTDIDNDGKLTVNDALYAAHEAKYQGGAAAGYASSDSEWGLSLDKLWGEANGGSYGYYVNNQSAMGLGDTVKEGDYLSAYVYTDLTSWSDMYCYFDKYTVSAGAAEEITLTLTAAAYDAEYNPITVPVQGATITVNGKDTAIKTDQKGKATIKLDDGGKYVISATSDTQILVPPVCMATVTAAEVTPSEPNTSTPSNLDTSNPQTGDGSNTPLFAVLFAVSVCGMAVLTVMRKKSYEK